MNKETNLRGNMCHCGNIWFTLDLPESDPTNCPFCNSTLECDDDSTEEAMSPMPPESDTIADNMKEGLLKLSGDAPISFASKICTFCNNEIFIDEIDINKANHCPFCKQGNLISSSEFKRQTQNPTNLNGLTINELIGQTVFVKFKSIIPFKKPQQFYFAGVDLSTMKIKLIDSSHKVCWKDFNKIKEIYYQNDTKSHSQRLKINKSTPTN